MLRKTIENAFDWTGRLFYRHPFLTLIVCFAFIALLAMRIPSMEVDTSSEALLDPQDPSRLAYKEFQDQFGRSELVILTVTGPVFTMDFLRRLEALHQDLEENTPYVKEVTSLFNVRNTRGEDDALVVEDLLEDWPDVDLELIHKRVRENPLYAGHVISADGRVAAIVVETEAVVPAESGGKEGAASLGGFDGESSQEPGEEAEVKYFGSAENDLVVQAVKDSAARHHGRDFEIAVSGGPVVVDWFNKATIRDMEVCTLLALSANAIFLLLLFRRFTGVIFPQVIVITALVSTLGLLDVFDLPLKMTTTIIPGFLVAVGLADSVHILAIFYRRLDRGSSKEDAIAGAMSHSGIPVVLTTATTAAGLLSFSMAELAAIAEVGRFAAAGVCLALLYTMVMLPAFVALTPIHPKPPKKEDSGRIDRILLWFADFSASHPKKIVFVSLLFLFAGVAMIFTLKFSNNIVDYFPDDQPVKKDLYYIDDRLSGTVTLEGVVDTGKENGLYEPGFLNRVEGLSRQAEKINEPGFYVGKVFSVTDIVKEINQALNDNDPAYYSIPQDRQQIAQELLLFENSGSEDLEKVADSRLQEARITIKTNWVDAVVLEHFLQEMKSAFSIWFPGMDVVLTGEMSLMARTIPATLRSMTKSYFIAFGVIALMMMALVGDVRVGAVAMFPNVLPIIFVMGLIGLVQIPLNLNTIMIGSIAMGMVVDDTMHFIYNFRRYYQVMGDANQAVRATLLSTGRALFITTMVLCSGFFALMFGSLHSFKQFGFFTGLIILFALVADFLLAAALMILLTRRREKQALKKAAA